MRLNKLEIENFGSIKHRAVIDFSAIGNDIFLFSGGTGCGKTTILDAISFALFGQCSGSDRCKLDVGELLSDYAKTYDAVKKKFHRDRLEVMLSFAHNGKQYQVIRNVTWKSKGYSDSYIYSSELNGDCTPIASEHKDKNKNEVTLTIEKIIGLNASQFNQVAILAQGEFEKFMKASPEEREGILTKLVDNNAFVDLQYRLKLGKDEAERRKKHLYTEIEAKLAELEQCHSFSEAEKNAYTLANPNLLKELQEGIKLRKEALAQLAAQKNALAMDKSAQEQAKAVAERANEELAKQESLLREQEQRLESYKEAEGSIKGLEQEIALAERLQRVLPARAALLEATDAAAANKKKIAISVDKEKQLQERAKEQEAAQNEAKERLPQAEELQQKAYDIEKIKPHYTELQQVEKILQEREKTLHKAQVAQLVKHKKYTDKQQEITSLKQELETLGQYNAAQVELAQVELEKLTERGKNLSLLQQLLADSKKQERKLCQHEQKQAVLQQQAEASFAEYTAINERFILGQAASLVASMKQQLQEKNGQGEPKFLKVACPVCQHEYTLNEVEQFTPKGEVIAKAVVDAAYDAYEEKRKTLDKHTLEGGNLQLQLEKTKTEAVERAQALGIQESYEILASSQGNGPVEAALEQCRSKYKAQSQALDQLQDNLKQKQDKEKTLQGAEQELPELEKAVNEADTSFNEAVNQNNLAMLAKQQLEKLLMGYPATEQLAKAEQVKLEQESKDIKKAFADAEQALTETEKNILSTATQTQQLQGAQEELEQKASAKEETLKLSLMNNGFLSLAELDKGILSLKMTTESANWSGQLSALCTQHRKDIDEYRKDVQECNGAIAGYKKALEGKVKKDLEPFTEIIAGLEEKLQVAEKAWLDSDEDIRTLLRVQKKVQANIKERTKYEAISKVLAPLAIAAEGSVSLNRFVLNRMFKRILERANLRLEKITSGEFELLPVEEITSGKSKQGLDFYVRNVITGSRHKASELSGGEKFETSLSLALGLSDIMQSFSSKAVKLETLFIDEGFGTLGEENLQKTKAVLLEIAGTERQIGIISHNPLLEEGINKKIIVSRNKFDQEGTTIKTAY